MQKLIVELQTSMKEIEMVKNALHPSKKESILVFKTLDGQYFQVTGTMKKIPKP